MHKNFDDSQAFDELLSAGYLKPPDDFTSQVMRRVQTLPTPTIKPQAKDALHKYLKWLALLGGATLGAAELVAFVFGIWVTTAAA